MTSVVGILNRRGVAIAADSAVTRNVRKENHSLEEKVTNNGNKMVRLSDVDHICILLTGNADFLGVPWDVIVRRYRQLKGKEHIKTVEDAAKSFFDFIASGTTYSERFWNETSCGGFLKNIANSIFDKAISRMESENQRETDGTLKYPDQFRSAFIKNASSIADDCVEKGRCPQFESYPITEFRKTASDSLDEFFYGKCLEDKPEYARKKFYPKDVLDGIRPAFEETLLKVLGSRLDEEMARIIDPSTLIFVGYGKDQDYPSLVSAVVFGGYSSRVNYFISGVTCISETKPVAICPFAQKDVIKSILFGISDDWSQDVMKNSLNPDLIIEDVFRHYEWEEESEMDTSQFREELDNLFSEFSLKQKKTCKENYQVWEKALENYDLEEMAALADSLINLTGFQRILTFQQEGVGGLVDLGVISKNEGFTWLRRKSWYHKDVGGKDGRFGV